MNFRNERAFTDAVVDLAKMNGFLVHHDRGDMRQRIQGHAGFVDLVLAKSGRVFFWELKMKAGTHTPAQLKWIAALPGAETIYPSDWDSIVRVLTAR